jgi:hypothetical protein
MPCSGEVLGRVFRRGEHWNDWVEGFVGDFGKGWGGFGVRRGPRDGDARGLCADESVKSQAATSASGQVVCINTRVNDVTQGCFCDAAACDSVF